MYKIDPDQKKKKKEEVQKVLNHCSKNELNLVVGYVRNSIRDGGDGLVIVSKF